MSDFSDKQVEELLQFMPAMMALLRRRAEANDPDAKVIFDALDTYCWHEPICTPGAICEGGLPRRRLPAVLR